MEHQVTPIAKNSDPQKTCSDNVTVCALTIHPRVPRVFASDNLRAENSTPFRDHHNMHLPSDE